MSLLSSLLLCLTFFSMPSAKTSAGAAIPEYLADWIRLSAPEPLSKGWYAAAYSEYEWMVEMKNGRPVAHRRNPKAEDASALPSVLKHADGKQDERGTVHALQVNNGWLVDYNAGEWGGSLWWYSPDGKARYKISNDQIHQFLPTKQGLFALEGLAHLTISYGKIVQLKQDAQGKWTSNQFVKLGYAPEVGLVKRDGDFVVCTTDTLVLVHPNKTQTVLVSNAFWGGLYPCSIALSPEGDIYIGMRHGVSRIRQVDRKYKVDWLLPNDAFVHAKAKL